jgi:hypothetical protein
MTLDLKPGEDDTNPATSGPVTPETQRALKCVARERCAQYTKHSWTTGHDDRIEVNNELTLGSIAYALAGIDRPMHAAMFYPWGKENCPRRDDTNPKRRGLRVLLVKAAALLIAAIEQIDRGNVNA